MGYVLVTSLVLHPTPLVGQNQISTQLLDCFERESDPFLHSVVTHSEMWVHYFIPQIIRASIEWQCKDSSPPKEVKYTFCRERIASVVIIPFSDRTVNHEHSLLFKAS
jgi:hypothetical protein